MIDTLALEVAITRSRITKKKLASKLGISSMGLYKKINNMSEFKASEIFVIAQLLNLDINERDSIFFNQFVDFKSTS